MIDRLRPRRFFPAPIPVGDQKKLPCSTCHGRVDPLRAPRVAIFDDRFHYFCSPECRVRFVPGSSLPPPPLAPMPDGADRERRQSDAGATAASGGSEPGEPGACDTGSESRAGESRERAAEIEPGAGPVAGSRWLGAAIGLGLVGAAATLPGLASVPLPRWLPALCAALACTSFLIATSRERGRGATFARVNPTVASAAALLALALDPARVDASARLAAVVSGVAAASVLWIAHQRSAFDRYQRWLGEALGLDLLGDAPLAQRVDAIKPGEELVLQAGGRVHVDVVITAGRARVEPWPWSRLLLSRGEGDGLLAGATLKEGALRAMVRWVGNDRGWARLGIDPARRADRHLAVARFSEWLATSGTAALGVVACAVSLSLDVPPLLAVAQGAAVAAALGNAGLPQLIALYVAQGVHRLALRGICFRNASALDRAGRTSTVVFCDRGTLLSGELSVASIEPASDIGENELLTLLAGAHAGVASPLAAALTRSLSAQRLRPDATRSPNHLPGLGVTAVASNGQALVAGTRALLLARRISVASAETRIAELEALGRSVLLVALDGRWVGLVALQDGLRPGARAATQTLLDAGIEPVLLSGEARETCRALARHIGIEHVRPEVLPNDRAAEVRRLARAPGTIAVVGSSIDDAALAAAPLSINIDARGGPLERCDIDIASGDVRDAAAAVQLARALHAETRTASFTALAPAAIGLLALFVGLPTWSMPLLGLFGAMLAARRLGIAANDPATSASAMHRRGGEGQAGPEP
jgi:Cu+-exporting ATPase